jgi:hypothetical protein
VARLGLGSLVEHETLEVGVPRLGRRERCGAILRTIELVTPTGSTRDHTTALVVVLGLAAFECNRAAPRTGESPALVLELRPRQLRAMAASRDTSYMSFSSLSTRMGTFSR